MKNFILRSNLFRLVPSVSIPRLFLFVLLSNFFVASNISAQGVITVTSTGGTESCSSYIEFVISGATNTYLTLALVNGTAIGAGQDFGSNSSSNLQIYNGSAWENYTNYIVIPASGFVLVRTPLVADALNESTENFQLKATPISSAVAGLPVYDVNYQVINLTAMTWLSGTAEQVNAVYLKTNAITVAGQAIDVRVTITGRSNVGTGANDFVFDDDGSNASRFQPQINSTSASGSYVDFSFKFYLSGTTTQVALENFYVTGVDVDGTSASATEFIELKNISSYSIDNSSLLTVTSEFRPGFTRFYGIPSTLNGITFENSASFVANYLDPLEGLEMRLGFSGSASSARLFSLNLGSSVGSFSTPSATNDADIVFGTASINNTPNEVCNGIDDDCDGSIDEGVQNNYYADSDGDGYGAGTATAACTAPTGYVTTNTDCNSTNGAVYPGATEICNSIDDDCDTQIDEGLTFINYYADADADGYGAGTATNACSQPVGFVTSNTDCNNSNSAVNPGATEVSNSIDDNCNGQIDEGLTFSVTPSSQTNVSCYGGSNGAASINTPTGGAGGYTYNWTPGNPTGDGTVSVTGLTAGTWTCTVTDANSVTATTSFVITQPAAISVTPSSQTNVSCFGGSNGAATINTPTGGAGGYTYDWTPGTPTGDGTVSVTGLTAGTWTCTVTDANSCTATQSFTVTQPTALSVTPSSQTNVACFGGSTGAASINTPTGGAGGYTYNWTPGNPTGDGTASVTGLTAGTWTCTVTDANSCTATRSFTVTQPTALSVTPSSQTNVSCFGGSNGAASINTPTGGAGAYTYNWTPGNPTGDGTASVTGLTAGTWTCTVTDANSCTATTSLTITEPSAVNAPTGNASQTFCSTVNATIASIQVTGTGIQWYASNTGGSVLATTTPLVTGTTYYATQTISGCESPSYLAVTVTITVASTYYLDADGDSYGNAGSSVQACTLPLGYVTNSSDCNDTNIAINPTTTWYLNADGDGYYVWTSVSCTSPGANYNTTGGILGDCNDTNAAVHTGATETCNGIDDDCDGMIDENAFNTY